MTPATDDLSPELRTRLDNLRTTVGRLEDDLERAAAEASDLCLQGAVPCGTPDALRIALKAVGLATDDVARSRVKGAK